VNYGIIVVLLDNKNNEYVGKELRQHLMSGSRFSVLSGLFTIYAHQYLKKELSKLGSCPGPPILSVHCLAGNLLNRQSLLYPARLFSGLVSEY
jgi:hypothetical protein